MAKSNFDKEDILKDELIEKINEIKNICYQEKIPFFISLCYKNTDEKSYYYNDVVGSKSSNINLTNDLFRNYSNVANGFITIPASNRIDIDLDFISQEDFDKE